MASQSQNMSLIKWTALSDRFNYLQLADNFEKLDAHDHTSGKGVQIPEMGLAPESVSASKLQVDAVETSKILNNAVTGAKIQSSASVDADRAISTNHIKNNAVTAEKMGFDVLEDINDTIERGIDQLEALSGNVENWESAASTEETFVFSYDPATDNADPGVGEFRLSSDDLSEVTRINLSATDKSSPAKTTATIMAAIANKQAIFKAISGDGDFATYRINSFTPSTPTPSPAYYILDVTFVEGSGNFNNLTSTDTLSVSVYAVGLMNGWSGFARYYRDNSERVHIEIGRPGEPAAGPWNAVAFMLPEDYRPSESVWVQSYPGMVRVYPDGRVRPMNNLLGFEPKDGSVGPATPLLIASGSFRVASVAAPTEE